MNLFDTNRILFVLSCLSLVTVTFVYSKQMWSQGHYQFFPLLIAAVAYLFFSRYEEITEDTRPGGTYLTAFLFLMVAVVAFFSQILASAFVGAVALWLFALTVVYWLVGGYGVWKASPLLFLLLIVIPLPGNYDDRLINDMQFLASNLASASLDSLGFVHFREGVVLVTEKEQFFTEEACSGIRSLYSSLAGIAIYSVVNGYRWWRVLFNLIQAVGWVIIGNTIRVASVVWIADNWTTSIAEGTTHEMFGVFIFVLIILLAISTDRLVSSIFPAPEMDDDEFDEKEVKPVTVNVWGRLTPNWTHYVLIPVFLLVLLVGGRLTYASLSMGRTSLLSSIPRLPFLTEEDMPAQVGLWKKVGFKHEHRGKSQMFAEDSFVWTYSNGVNQAQFSVDCPWHEFHDLALCYRAIGWDVATKVEFNRENSNQLSDYGFNRLKMKRKSGETGVVFFSAVDRDRNEVAPTLQTDFRRRIARGIATAMGGGSAEQYGQVGLALPISMFQLYCEPSTKADQQEVEELRKLFFECRKIVSKTRRFQSAEKTYEKNSGNETEFDSDGK